MQFSINEAIKTAWALFLDNAGLLVAVFATVFIINGLGNYLVHSQSSGLVVSLFQIINSLIALWLMMGQLKIGLMLTDGQRPRFSQLFLTTKPFWSFVVTAILFNFMVIVGLCFLIVPGIICLVRFSFAFFVVLHRHASPIEALRESARITKGHSWKIFGFFIVLSLIITVGVCALIIGMLVAFPVCLLASAFVYRWLIKETMIEPENGPAI